MLRRCFRTPASTVLSYPLFATRLRHESASDKEGPPVSPNLVDWQRTVTTNPVTTMELMFQPFRSTTQDRWLIGKCSSSPDKPLIITAYHGCRKSMTAQRICKRVYFWSLWREVVYVEQYDWNI